MENVYAEYNLLGFRFCFLKKEFKDRKVWPKRKLYRKSRYGYKFVWASEI